MKVRRVRWDGFRVPLSRPFETAHGSLTHREGLLVRITTDAGLVGLGEISPLPAFGGSTLADARAVLARWAPSLIGADVEAIDGWLTGPEASEPGTVAARGGLDVAIHDALARRRGVSVAALLGGAVRATIPVNAAVAAADPAVAATAARSAVTAGFGHLKLKVGIAGSPEAEVARVAAVRAAIGPTPRLRLDANGAWDVEQAIRILEALEPFDLELVEQPVPADDLEGLARVRHAIRTPIAADESVTGPARAREILEVGAAEILVVKPLVVGGLRPASAIVRLAREAGRAVVVTTALDAGVGIAAALHLAATLPDGAPASGLATGGLLADDLIAPALPVDRGTMRLPDGPGLGVAIDEEQLARYASGRRGEVGG